MSKVRTPVDGSPRRTVIGGSVSPTESLEIVAAFKQARFRTKSQAARAILLAYSRSTIVRSSVADFLRENPEAA